QGRAVPRRYPGGARQRLDGAARIRDLCEVHGCWSGAIRLTLTANPNGDSMPKVDDVAWMSQRHGFLVRQDDDQPFASFEFTSEAAAQAAQKQMQEIFATGRKAMGYA